jgi:hypothetical protein
MADIASVSGRMHRPERRACWRWHEPAPLPLAGEPVQGRGRAASGQAAEISSQAAREPPAASESEAGGMSAQIIPFPRRADPSPENPGQFVATINEVADRWAKARRERRSPSSRVPWQANDDDPFCAKPGPCPCEARCPLLARLNLGTPP